MMKTLIIRIQLLFCVVGCNTFLKEGCAKSFSNTYSLFFPKIKKTKLNFFLRIFLYFLPSRKKREYLVFIIGLSFEKRNKIRYHFSCLSLYRHLHRHHHHHRRRYTRTHGVYFILNLLSVAYFHAYIHHSVYIHMYVWMSVGVCFVFFCCLHSFSRLIPSNTHHVNFAILYVIWFDATKSDYGVVWCNPQCIITTNKVKVVGTSILYLK